MEVDQVANLKIEINNLNDKIINFEKEIFSQKQEIDQFNIDKNELVFLRLNLEYGHKCRKSFFNSKGYSVGSEDYKQCVLRKGRLINE